jgi:hypothetical protein
LKIFRVRETVHLTELVVANGGIRLSAIGIGLYVSQ